MKTLKLASVLALSVTLLASCDFFNAPTHDDKATTTEIDSLSTAEKPEEKIADVEAKTEIDSTVEVKNKEEEKSKESKTEIAK
jgi:hypothetical protein